MRVARRGARERTASSCATSSHTGATASTGARRSALNRLAHFRADVEDVRVHFVHERGQGPDPLPLVLTHGWPSTFYELMPLIPLLTDPGGHGGDPADAFDVV